MSIIRGSKFGKKPCIFVFIVAYLRLFSIIQVMAVRIVRAVIRLFFWIFVDLDVQGLEYLPATGGYIAAANHLGRMDVPIIYHLLNRDDVTLMVAEKYKKSAVWRWFVKNMNAIFVDRYNADFHALRVMLNHLKSGGVLVIAPEGTRSPTGTLIEGRPGGSYLAAKAGVPIIPVGVTGTEDRKVVDQLKAFRKIKIAVRLGKPFTLPQLDSRDREAGMKQHTDEIMCHIAALLPPSYRGVYTEHPRLKILLAE
jgi:1-acyl-sn-glycerol-3-phosphate acyltransferase